MKPKVWFTSDQHYYHRNVIKYCNRPFRTRNPFIRLWEAVTGKISQASVERMNEELIRRHNEVVGEFDIVYHLGDFSLWKHGPEAILPRLNGCHYLIPGNHDWCHPVVAKKNQEKMEKLYRKAGFIHIFPTGVPILIGSQWVTLHHMPYLNPESEQFDARYKELRPVDSGDWLLHGHIHQHWKVKGRMINVGVDVWDYYPVALEEIEKIINELGGSSVGRTPGC